MSRRSEAERLAKLPFSRWVREPVINAQMAALPGRNRKEKRANAKAAQRIYVESRRSNAEESRA